MDINQPALVLLNGDGIENSMNVNFLNSSWINDTIFRARFDVSDQNIEIEDITVEVDFALDANGNSQNAYEEAEVFDLDTKNPELISLSSSDYFIDQSDVGDESFNFILIFDEEMESNASVDLTFSPQNPVNSILQVNQDASVMLNPFTYQIVFDVFESMEIVPSVDVVAGNAFDLAGNAMNLFEFENILSIDMGTLGVNDILEDGAVMVYPTLLHSGDQVNIKLMRSAAKARFIIRDVHGKTLQENNLGDLSVGLHVLPLSNFSRGVYIYELALDSKFYTGKLIIQ